MSEHPEIRKIEQAEMDRWAPPEAPLEMPEQALERTKRRALGLRLLSLMFPSNA